jgi:hypothetical protein
MQNRTVIGVTGHRKLENSSALAAQIRRVVEQIAKKDSARILRALSSLAEGADRLVADEILRFPGAELEVALPLPKSEYAKDFASADSRAEFERLLARACRVVELPAAPSRNAAYFNAGRYVVDHCDVLIALWDGKPARGLGGTAEVVEYARSRRRELYWIHTSERSRDATHEHHLRM